jgi:hypothetical protein
MTALASDLTQAKVVKLAVTVPQPPYLRGWRRALKMGGLATGITLILCTVLFAVTSSVGREQSLSWAGLIFIVVTWLSILFVVITKLDDRVVAHWHCRDLRRALAQAIYRAGWAESIIEVSDGFTDEPITFRPTVEFDRLVLGGELAMTDRDTLVGRAHFKSLPITSILPALWHRSRPELALVVYVIPQILVDIPCTELENVR